MSRRKKSKSDLVSDVVDNVTSMGEDVVDAVTSLGGEPKKKKKKRSLVKKLVLVGLLSAVAAAVYSYRKAASEDQPTYTANTFTTPQ